MTAAHAALTLPGRLLFRVAEGADFEHVPTHRAARLRLRPSATHLDGGGALDQAILRHTGAMRVTRAFNARAAVFHPERAHLEWDPLERRLGLSRTFRLHVDPEADVRGLCADLAGLAAVELAAPQFVCETPFGAAVETRPGPAAAADPYLDEARAIVGANEALAMEPGDTALIVGLVDSGVAMGHAELGGRLRPGLNTVSGAALSEGIELLSGPRTRVQDVSDDHGHGTECGSILCSNGFRIPRGVAGAARLLPIRSLCGARLPQRTTPTAVGSLVDIDSGVKSAIDLGARVLNLSFGTPETALGDTDYLPHLDVVRYALARDCLLIVASGNSGDTTRYFPAALPGVFAVGSVDAQRRPSRFTSRGAHVFLSAPGERLRCARPDGYGDATGTSFAAPLVAGACALLLARAARQSLALPPMAVRDLLVRSAAPFAAGAETEGCGAGVLDIAAALRALDDDSRAPPEPDQEPDATEESNQASGGPPPGPATARSGR